MKTALFEVPVILAPTRDPTSARQATTTHDVSARPEHR
ncbi:hypothetical protein EHYA_09350 [Embleya hyalina]|uniref:Uncharacterized protein n=1 Tax=Embleya hyalina TaxID=516124 RepID=A0A401Z408_9ACTN|nr:hypothetical protein EHYA_09350 [Embleya hyalina]